MDTSLDFIIIDAEHAQTSTETMVEMSRASELYGMAAFARVYDPGDGPMMSRLLDVGIHGIMVPLVETREQADMVIQYMKFPPLGRRGANGGRGPRWGIYENYARQANENLYVIMQTSPKIWVTLGKPTTRKLRRPLTRFWQHAKNMVLYQG